VTDITITEMDILDPLDYYRQNLLLHFEQNRLTKTNPDAIFFFGFTEEHIASFREAIPEALDQLSRPHIVIDCSEKTFKQIYLEAIEESGKHIPQTVPTYEAAQIFNDILLNGAFSLVLAMFSEAKGSHKPGHARSLIKLLDDAHFENYNVMSDVVFIDRAGFLEKSWGDIGHYIRLVGPYNAMRGWMDSVTQSAKAPYLEPV